MRVYARLFYNNIERFLAETFRVFHAITGNEAWQALVRDFLRRHRAASPYFSHIPEEFLEYLGNIKDAGQPPTPPFALELCHYEWVRLALKLAPDADCAYDDVPLGVNDAVAVSPLAWPLRYAFPVQGIGPARQPDVPPARPTFLIAWRDRHDTVRVTASNATTLRLLQLLDEEHPLRDCCAALATETGVPADQLVHRALTALNDLRKRDIVVRRAPLATWPRRPTRPGVT